MESRRKKPKRKSAFVPSVVFTTAIAGVVPACVVGCGNNGSGGTTPPGVANCAYGGTVGNCPTVAAVGYCAFCDGGRGDATTDAPSDVSTDAPDASGDSAGGDATGDTSPPDGPLGVADAGFRGD